MVKFGVGVFLIHSRLSMTSVNCTGSISRSGVVLFQQGCCSRNGIGQDGERAGYLAIKCKWSEWQSLQMGLFG